MLVFAGCYTEEVCFCGVQWFSLGKRTAQAKWHFQGIAQLNKANKSSNRLRAFSLDICNESSIEEAKKFVENELLAENRGTC